MYKIYINEKPLYLTNREESRQLLAKNKNLLVLPYRQSGNFLFQCIDNLEKGGDRYPGIVIWAEDIEKLKNNFWSLYKVQEAGGGLVFNSQNQILAIYRNDWWDLPKGKIDPGEDAPTAAIREVEEETGIQQVKLDEFLTHTYHTFQRNEKRILKVTHWFKMTGVDDGSLVPQQEEGIEKVLWIDVDELKNKQPIYSNIIDALSLID